MSQSLHNFITSNYFCGNGEFDIMKWKRSTQNFTNILGFFGFINMCFFQTKNLYFSLFFRYDDVEAKSPATHWRDPGLSSAARLDNQDQSGWQGYFQLVMAHQRLGKMLIRSNIALFSNFLYICTIIRWHYGHDHFCCKIFEKFKDFLNYFENQMI